MAPLNAQLAKLDREMVQLGRRDPRVDLLQTAPQVAGERAPTLGPSSRRAA